MKLRLRAAAVAVAADYSIRRRLGVRPEARGILRVYHWDSPASTRQRLLFLLLRSELVSHG